MGYAICQNTSNVRIKRESIPAALAAVQSMAAVDLETGKAPMYSWVPMDFFKETSLEAILHVWRWNVEREYGGNGDVIMLNFRGEKLGSEEELFSVLAPFIEHGGYIEMLGEDNELWRWVFWRGELRVERPRVIWDYEQLTPVSELMEGIDLD